MDYQYEMSRIFTQMRKEKISVQQVERLTGFSWGQFRRLYQGTSKPKLHHIQRIRLVLSRIRSGDAAESGEEPQSEATLYRVAIMMAAQTSTMKPSDVLAHDPARRATADPAWMEAARVRRLAIYIAHNYFGVPQASLARRAGMSKAAVCTALQDVEEARDEQQLDALMAPLEEVFW